MPALQETQSTDMLTSTDTSSVSLGAALAFLPEWLRLLDDVAPLDAFRKYLVDGDFEHWRYPDAAIHNVDELESYFNMTWGTIERNTSTITRLELVAKDQGRFLLTADVGWTGYLPGGETRTGPLRYTVEIGFGTSHHDTTGQYPKVYRYQMDRLSD